jgi:hypothetical protein
VAGGAATTSIFDVDSSTSLLESSFILYQITQYQILKIGL